MANKENLAPLSLTTPTKKRPSAPAPQRQSKRKRVPLGELPAPQRLTRSRPTKEAARNPPPIVDSPTDSEVGEDPQLCSHYATDIYCYLRSMEIEQKRRPLANFIELVQNDVTPNMRGILVDWLVEVAEEYKLVSETLYLTISYVDRFLSFIALSRQELQLLGVSCMLIASKFEEISPPHLEDFCYITDNTYTKQEMVKMEADVLKFLNFEMSNPTIKIFLRRFIRFGKENGQYNDLQLEFLSNYLAELSLLDYGCAQFLPSLVAASALYLARFTLKPNIHPWSQTLQQQTGYFPSELKDCILILHDLQLNRRSSSFIAIREKYKQHRFKCVSMLLPPVDIPISYFEGSKHDI